MDSRQLTAWIIFIGGTIILLAVKYWVKKAFAAHREKKARLRKD
jgi:hypothetical protein